MAVTFLHEGVYFRITAEDDGLIHARSLDDNMPAFLAEDAEEFTEIVREVHYITLHDATGVLLAQYLARVTLEAERAWAAQEMTDPCAGIFVSDAEAQAFDEAVRRKKLRYRFYDGMDPCETDLDDLIRSNLDGPDFLEFLGKVLLPSEVGQTVTFNGGAAGETEFTRLPDREEGEGEDEGPKLTRCGDCGDTGTIMNGAYCVCAVGCEQEASLRESEEHASHDEPSMNPGCRYCRRLCLRVEVAVKDNREDDKE